MNKFVKAMVAVVVAGLAAGSVLADPNDWRLGVKISANPSGGLRIHDVFPGSPAEQAGLKPGMILLTVDGVLYNDPLAARDKIMLKSGDQLNLVYQDGSAFYQVTAQLTTTTVATIIAQPYVGQLVQKAWSKTVQKTQPKVVPLLKDVRRVRVADPRLKQ